MSAVRHQATYNGIIFNRVYGGTDPDAPGSLTADYENSDYRLEVFDDSPVQVRDLSEARQMMEGSEPNQAFEVLRLVRGQGVILGSSYADLEDKVWALRNAFSPATVRRLSTRAIVGGFPDPPTGVLPFKFKRDTVTGGQLNLLYYCRPQVGRPSVYVTQKGGLARPFAFALAAYDPRCYDNTGDTHTTAALSNLAGGDNTVSNAGNAVTYPQIKIVLSGNGSATFVLTNTTTGQAITLNLSSAGAGTFWLMTEKGTIINTSRVGHYDLKKTATQFLTNLFMIPGNNVWTVSGNTNLTSVTLYYRPAYS